MRVPRGSFRVGGLLPGLPYSEYRLAIIAVGLALAAALFWMVKPHPFSGSGFARAPPTATWRARWEWNTSRLFTLVFGLAQP